MHDLTAIPTVADRSDLLPPFAATAQQALAADWAAWLRGQVDQGQLAEGTRTTYLQAVQVWLSFLGRVAHTDQPTPGTVSAYVAAVIPGRRPATVNRLLGGVRALYAWAEARDRHPDIARAVRGLRVDRSGPLPCLAHDGVRDLLAMVDGDDLGALRDRALVAVLYGAGLRLVSAARATIANLDLAAATLRHRPKGHRGDDATAYLPPSAARAVGEYLQARAEQAPLEMVQPLFIALDRRSFGAPLSTCTMSRVVRRLMERAGHARRGADGRLVNPGQFTAHSLRRSALTTAADAHGIEVAAAVAGHASPETTRRAYVRSKLDGRLREVAAVLDLGAALDGS